MNGGIRRLWLWCVSALALLAAGVDEALWRRVRRPWLNLFQANADENALELRVSVV